MSLWWINECCVVLCCVVLLNEKMEVVEVSVVEQLNHQWMHDQHHIIQVMQHIIQHQVVVLIKGLLHIQVPIVLLQMTHESRDAH
jgi:hypothetical protein